MYFILFSIISKKIVAEKEKMNLIHFYNETQSQKRPLQSTTSYYMISKYYLILFHNNFR